jgi:hypothetical protein
VHKKISTLCLVVAFGFTLNGCSSMSAQARRERAYNHYVQKQMRQRQRQTARAQKAANREMKKKMKLAKPSDPILTTSLEPSPGAWSEPTAESVAPPSEAVVSPSDTVVPPVTVSASDSIATQNPQQPSQP